MLRYTCSPPKRKTSLSSVTTPSTRPSASSHAHCASASTGATMNGSPKSCAGEQQGVGRKLCLDLRVCVCVVCVYLHVAGRATSSRSGNRQQVGQQAAGRATGSPTAKP
eukprot:365011-Chlamydomonas_euryale.AAC.3